MVRRRRNASERWLCGLLCTISGCSGASGSSGIVPMTDVSVTRATSASVRTRVSSIARRIASPMPSPSPRNSASPTFSRMLGDAGASGAVASRTTEIFTAEALPSWGASISLITSLNWAAMASASAAAIAGLASEIVTLISEVFAGDSAATRSPRVSARSSSPRSSMTGIRTSGLVTSWVYVVTCWRL